jgi:hypothetical protein
MPLAFWGDLKAILAWEKIGQFMVRTHVRKYHQNLKKLRIMSGVLNYDIQLAALNTRRS